MVHVVGGSKELCSKVLHDLRNHGLCHVVGGAAIPLAHLPRDAISRAQLPCKQVGRNSGMSYNQNIFAVV